MPAVRFQVVETFNLPQRGIVVSGTLLEGVIRPGMTLRNLATSQPVRVRSVEFPTPRTRRLNLTAILIDPQDATGIAKGTELTTVE